MKEQIIEYASVYFSHVEYTARYKRRSVYTSVPLSFGIPYHITKSLGLC